MNQTEFVPGDVLVALSARKAVMAAGPRTMADLARVTGLDPANLHAWVAGRRALPDTARAAIVRALPELPQ